MKEGTIPVSLHRDVSDQIQFGSDQLETEAIESSDNNELELPIDLIKRGHQLIVRTPIVGAEASDISLSVNQDVLFISKTATLPPIKADSYYTRECYWGPIAREIRLPLPVDPNSAQATLKDGVLTISLPTLDQRQRAKVIKIR